jgi:hypothetical protein
MNAVAESKTQETEVKNGTKAPAPGQVAASVAEVKANDEQTIAQLQARVIALEANQKPVTEKKAVPDLILEGAIRVLEAKNKADLSKLDLSLAKQLGFVPLFSAAQKADWKARRDAMTHAYSSFWRKMGPEVISHFRRGLRNPAAMLGGKIVTRKSDGAVNDVRFRASKLAKPLKAKGKGKGAAKPSQVAGKVSVPGNANPPAKVS